MRVDVVRRRARRLPERHPGAHAGTVAGAHTGTGPALGQAHSGADAPAANGGAADARAGDPEAAQVVGLELGARLERAAESCREELWAKVHGWLDELRADDGEGAA